MPEIHNLNCKKVISTKTFYSPQIILTILCLTLLYLTKRINISHFLVNFSEVLKLAEHKAKKNLTFVKFIRVLTTNKIEIRVIFFI